MDTDFYITAPGSKFPIDHAPGREQAELLLMRHRDRYPDAIAEPTAVYFERSRAETLASFPLSRITRRFYEAMLGALPPQHMRGADGFFLSEAATGCIHAQFIEHRGRTYGGYADLSRASRKIWTIADIQALEAGTDEHSVELDWFPAD